MTDNKPESMEGEEQADSRHQVLETIDEKTADDDDNVVVVEEEKDKCEITDNPETHEDEAENQIVCYSEMHEDRQKLVGEQIAKALAQLGTKDERIQALQRQITDLEDEDSDSEDLSFETNMLKVDELKDMVRKLEGELHGIYIKKLELQIRELSVTIAMNQHKLNENRAKLVEKEMLLESSRALIAMLSEGLLSAQKENEIAQKQVKAFKRRCHKSEKKAYFDRKRLVQTSTKHEASLIEQKQLQTQITDLEAEISRMQIAMDENTSSEEAPEENVNTQMSQCTQTVPENECKLITKMTLMERGYKELLEYVMILEIEHKSLDQSKERIKQLYISRLTRVEQEKSEQRKELNSVQYRLESIESTLCIPFTPTILSAIAGAAASERSFNDFYRGRPIRLPLPVPMIQPTPNYAVQPMTVPQQCTVQSSSVQKFIIQVDSPPESPTEPTSPVPETLTAEASSAPETSNQLVPSNAETTKQEYIQPVVYQQQPMQPVTYQQLPMLTTNTNQQLLTQPETNGQAPTMPDTNQQQPLQPEGYQQQPMQPVTYQQLPTQPVTYQQLPMQPVTYQQLPTQPGTYQQLPMLTNTYQQLPTQPETNGQAPTMPDTNQQQPIQPEGYQQQPVTYQQLPMIPNTTQQLPMQTAVYQQQPMAPGAYQQLPMQSEGNQQLPMQPEGYQQLPMQPVTYQQLPMAPGAYQQLPMTPDTNQQQPMAPGAYQQQPIQPEGYQQQPIQPEGYQQLPIQTVGYQQQPIQPEGYQQQPIQPVGYQQQPIQPEGYQQQPIQPEGYQQLPIQTEGYQKLPIQPEGYQQLPIQTEGNRQLPMAPGGYQQLPMIPETYQQSQLQTPGQPQAYQQAPDRAQAYQGLPIGRRPGTGVPFDSFTAFRPGSHRFKFRDVYQNRRCRWCWTLILPRNTVYCEDCGIMVHNSCKKMMPFACGDPQPIWARYNYLPVSQTDIPATPSFKYDYPACWVIIHRERPLRRYIVVHGANLFIYRQETRQYDIEKEVIPLQMCKLPPKLTVDLTGRARLRNVDKCIAYHQMCTPQRTPPITFILEFGNYWDREAIIDALLNFIATLPPPGPFDLYQSR